MSIHYDKNIYVAQSHQNNSYSEQCFEMFQKVKERCRKKQYHHKANVVVKKLTKQFQPKQDIKVDVKCKKKKKMKF